MSTTPTSSERLSHTAARVRRAAPSWLHKWLIVPLLLVPTLLLGAAVVAIDSPSESLQRVSVAVVNEDEPVEVDGQITPLGRLLTARLVDPGDPSIDWKLTNADDARQGLDSGEYSTVVTIPKSFSADGTSLSNTDPNQVRQASIRIESAPDAPIADVAIADAVFESARASIAGLVTSNYLDGIYTSLSDMGTQLDQAADGARQLADGNRQISDGTTQAKTGTSQLATGLPQLASGAGELAVGAERLRVGASDLNAGLGQLDTGAGQLTGGLDQMASQTATLPDQSRALADGSAQVASGTQQISDLLNTPGVAEALRVAGHGDVVSEVTRLNDGAHQVATGNAQLADSAGPLVSGIVAARDGAHQLADGIGTARDGSQQLADGAAQLSGGSNELSTRSGEAADGAVQLDDGMTQLVDGSGSAADGSRQLSDGLGQAQGQVPSYDEQQRKQLASTVADPVLTGASSGGFGVPLAVLAAVMMLWFAALVTSVFLRALPPRWAMLESTAPTWWLLARNSSRRAVSLVAQSAVVTAVLAWAIRPSVGAVMLVFLVVAVAMATFEVIARALRAAWLRAGLVVMAVALVIAGISGATSAAPGFVNAIGRFLPTRPATEALHAAVVGDASASFTSLVPLLLWMAAAALGLLLAAERQRSTSTTRLIRTSEAEATA